MLLIHRATTQQMHLVDEKIWTVGFKVHRYKKKNIVTSSSCLTLRTSLGRATFLLVSCTIRTQHIIISQIDKLSRNRNQYLNCNKILNPPDVVVKGSKHKVWYLSLCLQLSKSDVHLNHLPHLHWLYTPDMSWVKWHRCRSFHSKLWQKRNDTCLIIAPWCDDNSFKRFSAAIFLSMSTTNEFLLLCLSLMRSPLARAKSLSYMREHKKLHVNAELYQDSCYKELFENVE